MNKLEKYIALSLLVFAVVFNLWLYRWEPSSRVDPNDNAFQFGLVDRTNAIWNYADSVCKPKTASPTSPRLDLAGIPVVCTLSLLSDHWVHNWAQGYNLPYYYPHIPQIAIVGSWRALTGIMGQTSCWQSSLFPAGCSISLFSYYHGVIYLLMSLVPLAVFFGIRALGLPFITAGVGALLSSHISTDGLYGLDQTSYLWRGWGLSSQLFAALWMPLSLGYSIRFLLDRETLPITGGVPKYLSWVPLSWRRFLPKLTGAYPWAVLFTTAQVAGHLGLGLLMFIALGIASIAPAIKKFFQQETMRDIREDLLIGIIRVACIAIPAIGLLSYWILPSMIFASYHNISFWDPVWKFDSYGVAEVLVNLANGVLFDFDRYPVFTTMTMLAVFVPFFSSMGIKRPSNATSYNLSLTYPLSFLFVFWLLLYFGRTAWGSLIDLIPGMIEFHISRLIVMLHLLSMFMVPIAITWLGNAVVTGIAYIGKKAGKTIPAIPPLALIVIIASCAALLSYPQTLKYSKWNDVLIKQANGNWDKGVQSVRDLMNTLQSLPPGRIFAGRGGGFGKDFRIAETPYYMFISTFGYPTIAWLPETWSMNSDTEQYFSEDNHEHYKLYNLAHVIAPPTQKPQPFWSLKKETPEWNLYAVDTRTRQSSQKPDESTMTNYIGVGTAPTVIHTDKNNLINLVHLWIQSDYHTRGIYPELSYGKIPLEETRPQFAMVDEVTYRLRDNTTHSLMGEPPVYMADPAPMTVTSTRVSSDMEFSATVVVQKECPTCIALLRQTAHPNWKAWINGKSVELFTVMPFYSGVSITQPGTYNVVFRYEPSAEKVVLMILGIIASVGLLIIWIKPALKSKR